jgi:hypothetical protein
LWRGYNSPSSYSLILCHFNSIRSFLNSWSPCNSRTSIIISVHFAGAILLCQFHILQLHLFLDITDAL